MAKKGFFRQSQLVSEKIGINNSSQCKKCKLNEKAKNPYIKPTGTGNIKILHIASSVGKTEDMKGIHLAGKEGSFYKRILNQFSIDLNECIRTSAYICSSAGKSPTKTQIKSCRYNLLKTIEEIKPHVIIPLGSDALTALIGHKFDTEVGGINKYRGFVIPDREFNAWICPVYSPGFVMLETMYDLKNDSNPDITKKLFTMDIEQAVKMLDVPVPQYEKEQDKIEILKHKKDIIKFMNHVLKGYSNQSYLTAFDYETTALKPQCEQQQIWTCSIALSTNYAAAFPMIDDSEFLDLFKKYLKNSRIKKIAANLAFENTWSQVKLGTKVKGWFFDTMLAQHYLDNRPKATSLEFQNYIYFGITPYDKFIKKFIKPKKSRGNTMNTIHEADLYELLLYNGMDSLTEFMLGIVHMEILGIDFYKYYDCITNQRPQQLAPQYFINK